MPLRFNVELRDGSVCPMSTKAFNAFLSLDKVSRFKRSDGWVIVGKYPVRDLEKISHYPVIAECRSFVSASLSIVVYGHKDLIIGGLLPFIRDWFKSELAHLKVGSHFSFRSLDKKASRETVRLFS